MVRQIHVGEQLRVIRCQSGDEAYALALDQVRGFQRADRMRHERGDDGRIGHLATMSGAMPVYALADLLGRPRPVSAQAHIVVVASEGGAWGLLADQVSRVMTVPKESAHPLPALLRAWHGVPASRLLSREDEWLLLLQLEQLGPHRAAVSVTDAAEDEDGPLIGASARGQMMLFTTRDYAVEERRLAFGVSLATVGEIMDCPRLVVVPKTPPFVLGLVGWRGRAVPVVDVAAAFGQPASKIDRWSRLLLVWAGRKIGWIAVVARPGMHVVPNTQAHVLCQRDLGLDPLGIQGAVELSGETVVLPSWSRLLLPG